MSVLLALLILGADATGVPEGFVPPALVKTAPIEYPEEARKRGIEGEVLLHVLIDEEGRVVEVKVVSAPCEALGKAASEGVRKFEFTPARLRGKPVRVRIPLRIPFSLRRQPTGDADGTPSTDGTGNRSSKNDFRESTHQPRDATAIRSQKNDIPSPSPATGPQPSDATPPSEEATPTAESTQLAPQGAAEEIVVRSKRIREAVTTYTVHMDEVMTLPGIQGDPLKAVQAMPGVARPPFGIGMLVVRGSSPRDTKYFIEGHPVPLIYHFFALTSVLSDNLLKSIEFIPGNFSARFGRLAGGVVDVRLKHIDGSQRSEASVDLWGASVFHQRSTGEGSVAIAMRRSWVDSILRAIPEVEIAPFYYDAQILYERPVALGTLTLMGFGSYDSLTLLTDGSEPYMTAFGKVLALWSRTLGSVTVKASAASGPLWMRLEQEDELSYGFDVYQNTARLEVSGDGWRAGFDGEASWYDGWFRLSGRGGESSSGSDADVTNPFGNRDLSMDTTLLAAAVWGEYTWKSGRTSVTAGLRLDSLHASPYTLWNADPRLMAEVRVTPVWTVEAGAGLYTQEPQIQFLQEWLTHNPSITWERSAHLSVGAKARWSRRAMVRTTLFYKPMWDLITLATEQGSDGSRQLFRNQGLGRAYGMEVLAKFAVVRPARWVRRAAGWLAYTLMRSERKEDDETAWHVYGYDQTHILTAFASLDLARGWRLGARFRYTTGNPFSPPEGSIYDADTGSYVPVYGEERYTERLPAFHQLDVRLDKKWRLSWGSLTAYLDVQNVYNHRSSEFVVYNFDYSRYDTVKGMPIFPSIGLRGVW